MDSPSSVSSYCSSSLSSSFSTSPVNSDFSFPSDNEREGKSAHGLRPEDVGQRGGSRPSPGPIRCRHRLRVSSNQHTASHLEQRGSRVKGSRDGELGTSLHTQGCTTEGDLLFAQKCEELQGFIRPLTDLLNGLKMGRFDRGLSSFQQSVAMDRIQRIVGVLRKPQMGERYLGTLLQVEGMLKTWFPRIAAQKSSLGGSRHQISKHFPSHHSDSAASSPAPLMEKMGQTQLGHLVLKPKQPWHLTEWPAMNLTWIHSTPICNPPLSSQGSNSAHSSIGTGASIGVILVLQKGGQPFTHSALGTPIPPTTLSPVIPGDLKKLSREGPCYHSLPVTLPSDWSCTLCPPVLPTTVREMTTGHLESAVAPGP
ncbi:circadian-associated transcriptional repressor isoform X1 [Cricetulus griseus]|uniref:Circadian associated repressor of transcription n=2 Tax=Cricetulus griseus TaxID=10029 RepID=A0A061INM9_CRIGR|nr:circadian-associated transcriptional repressor isoform X1 [Cricetulus griseus]XP_016827365.1 circadian-associated transcriptional repressor isoform X1 [Cricetulus griseus]XP_027249467.1 circadian-associated transcriptional repressor isoform X1 [Cricetulus griseus]XP_027249468.1 circadian-associated transcriptional repressor isoform X1 [Cricetulus griseus]XP_035304150.1 circadian-associated transcriptional repressor isoform X1 [Cricetulus griseus]XP_035306881.1 circadian-associated transcrip